MPEIDPFLLPFLLFFFVPSLSSLLSLKIVKLWAIGVPRYFHSRLNTFDAIVVVISIIELLLTEIGGFDPIGLSVLRFVI